MPNEPLIYESDAVAASPAAAAETVVCALPGVTTRYAGQPIHLSGWINVTPDASATAVVLRVRRHNLTGTLVAPAQTIALGGAGGSATVIGVLADVVTADAATAVPMDGANHNVPCLIAAPPAWMDNAGNIIEAGLYAISPIVTVNTPPTVTGLFGKLSGPNLNVLGYAVNELPSLVPTPLLELDSLSAADLPFLATCIAAGDTDITGVLDVRTSIQRLASSAAVPAGGAGASDAVLDAVDAPGSLAGGTYVLTAQMTGAAAGSTVNGVRLSATIA